MTDKPVIFIITTIMIIIVYTNTFISNNIICILTFPQTMLLKLLVSYGVETIGFTIFPNRLMLDHLVSQHFQKTMLLKELVLQHFQKVMLMLPLLFTTFRKIM